MQQLPLGVRWRDNSVFASFVRGPNELAVRQLEMLAGHGPAIWIWGPPACGKTHLLQAACARIGELGRPAAYFPMNERDQFGAGVFSGCERLDLLCIDDIEQVAGDERWERELFLLYNAIQDHHGRLVLAASRAPAALAWGLADLASRMASSLVFQLRSLEETEQMEVLRARARRRGLELPEETARFLLRRFPRDLRSQCRLLERLDAASLAAQRRLTIPFIKAVIDAQGG